MTDAVELPWQVEAKAAFLASKGVDAYAIAQSACVSGGMYECFGPVQTEKYQWSSSTTVVRVACGMSENRLSQETSWDQVRWRECAIRAGRMRRSWEGALGPFRII